MSERKLTVLQSNAPKKIAKIQFGLLDSDEIKLAAEIRVSNREIYQMPARTVAPHGCMDSRLGISDKVSSCKTCGKKLADCAGHFGYIQLELPVYHAGYFRHTLSILQCICKRCSRVLLNTDDRNSYLKKAKATNIDALARGAMFKKICEICKRASTCPYCGYANGVVKKLAGGFLKIIHEKFRAKNADDHIDLQVRLLHDILQNSPELRNTIQKPVELINPMRAYELLSQIYEEDLFLLWMNGRQGRPESLLIWSVPVPPVPIRPSVPQETGGGSTEDDLTMKLQEIVELNNALRLALSKGATMKIVGEDWEILQIQVALYINGETPGIPRALQPERTIRGLCQRLKGKQGRFRGNLSGKRVDFSGRTVISPDPNLQIDQVGVPILVARVMTYPERVNAYNISRLRQMVINGPEKHPGANIVRSLNITAHAYSQHGSTQGGAQGNNNNSNNNNFFIVSLQYADRERIAMNLKVGDIVERHMDDDDVVLFNRQPSLHKMSIMAHRVKVVPWRTFRFNECACTPYNADFDGDEMNMHLPQTEEAKAEAATLMSISQNLVSPRNGEPLVAATQDFLTGAYMLTQKDVFFTKSEFCRLVAYLGDANEQIDLPLPTIWKPRCLWTGKQIISLLVRPNKASQCYVNVESEERFYTREKHFCAQDGYVNFRAGELISGNLGKKTLGGDSKMGLFYALIRDFGCEEATRCMSRLAKLTSRYLCDRGFSIGIDDVTPSGHMLAIKTSILASGQAQANEQISLYKTGHIRLKPGCDALQSLESEVNGILGKIRENCGKEAQNALNHRNAPLSMAQCGSKGSLLNISQMIACLGQQSVGGSRIENGFVNRTLPHFPVNSLTPEAKGFVANSFYSGLTATEFFFHTMGGREGLVDTAVKTAETGYMARRLMKALEDLSMQYDATIRNSEQTIVQFSYGDDGLNPQLMEKGDRPVDYGRLTVNVCCRNTTDHLPSVDDGQGGYGRGLGRDGGKGSSVGSGKGGAVGSARGGQGGGQGGDRPHGLDDTENTEDQDQHTLYSHEMLAIVESMLASSTWQALLPQGSQFLEETLEFFTKRAHQLKALETGPILSLLASATSASAAVTGGLGETILALKKRLRSSTPQERLAFYQQSKLADQNSPEYHLINDLIRYHTLPMTSRQLHTILSLALRKYHISHIEPGEAVGAVGAQSLSEPGTQMTLKTFHFAGVASMNVTLGVPRLKEIINASSYISTPIIEARLYQPESITSARIAKATVEKTTLGEICVYMKEVHKASASYLVMKLDIRRMELLYLTNITAYRVKECILHGIYAAVSSNAASSGGVTPGASTSIRPAVLRALKDRHIQISERGNKVMVFPPDVADKKGGNNSGKGLASQQRLYFTMQALKSILPNIIVQGIPTVSRAVINEEAGKGRTGRKEYHLLVEGYGLQAVMNCPGVDFRSTSTNHIMEMNRVLGIEAARAKISMEIKFIMSAYGISVDRRHLMLLSDVMTFKGEVLGITRFGVAKMKESVLMLASFEKTTDHLFDAAVHSREDKISGVSECIIMGVPIPIGTGIMKLIQKFPTLSAAAQEEDGTAAAATLAAAVPSSSNKIEIKRKKRLLDTLSEVDVLTAISNEEH